MESSTTPFMDVTSSSGAFVVAARLGVESTISGLSLRTGNHGSATVLPANTDPLVVNLDLAASGPVVTRVSPANGEKGVPRSATVTVELSEPVSADTVSSSSFGLVRASDGAAVQGRITLGAGRRSVAFLPEAALDFETSYRVSLTSAVTDANGNALLPFTSTFTTVAPDSDDFDPGAVQVSFPDAEGDVTVRAAAGSFEAGASITIVNVTNGIVVSSEVSFDGGFEVSLRASFTDELQIRILDSAGREVVLSKTEYRAEDGRVAIGSKGGTISAGDFELDVPEGALATAAIFRLTPLTEEEIASLPLPEGAGGIGSAVRVETGGVVLEEEADLSFPIPGQAPADALYLVVRAVEVSGELLYEVVDTASIEDGKVRTNSAPFPGLLYPGDHVLNWYPLQPSLPKTEIGLVVGLAQETGGTAAQPSSTPLGNVEVRLDKPPARGDYVARTLSNGRFTIVDVAFGFSGTTVALTGKTPDGRSARATAFEGTGPQQGVNPKFNRTGEAILNFQPTAPVPPPGRIAIRLFKEDGGPREETEEIAGGFIAVGTDILFTIEFTEKASPPARVVVGVAGASLPVTTVDEFHYEARFTPSDPRSYTLHVTAFDSFLREIFGDVSFLAVSGSTGNDRAIEGPPSILTSETSPRSGASGIDVHPIFSVKFSEPVKNVSAETVKLQAAGGGAAVPLELIGTGPGFGPAIPLPDSIVNALTLRPLEGLRFKTRYEIVFE
ncbi:MAG: Ig-like domain-containing protein, partial [Vicinamibacteria bacterium]